MSSLLPDRYRLPDLPRPNHPNFRAIEEGRKEMLFSLADAVYLASGDGQMFLDQAATMTVADLCKYLGTNSVRFVYAPEDDRRAFPPKMTVACGELTMLVEDGKLKCLTLDGNEVSGVRKVELVIEAGELPVANFSLVPAGRHPQMA